MDIDDDEKLKEELEERDVNVSSTGREMILAAEDTEEAIKKVQENFQNRIVVTSSDVRKVVEMDVEADENAEEEAEGAKNEEEASDSANEQERRETVREHYITWVSRETATSSEEFGDVSDDPFGDIKEKDREDPRDSRKENFTISEDFASRSESEGEMEDFIAYFRSRYEKLSKILKKRISPKPIEAIRENSQSQEVTVVGMVEDTRTSNSGNAMVYLEDTTGTIPVVFSDDEQIEECEQVINDEVVGVQGTLSDDGNIIYGDRLHFPDIPPRRRTRTADEEVKVAMISDVHFGAKDMAVDKWNRFVDWLYEREDIEYLLIAGDIVEGVGIYNGQKEQLSVSTIEKQYDLCKYAFEQMPDNLTVIVTPGNHDGVPLAEPQPTFPEKYRERFPENIHFGPNPATVEVEGVHFLMYHGVSNLPFMDLLPDGDVQMPTTGMWPMLQKRHIAPMYGKGVRILPEREDHLVMEEIPDVVHCGHVHTFDINEYNSVKLVNTGAWQHQTDYQKRLDIMPDVGLCSVFSLDDMSARLYGF